MGFVSDLRTLHRQSEQIRQGYDPVSTAQAGLVSMRAARRSMEAAAHARSSSSAREGVATILEVHDTGLRVGAMPVAELDLLVDTDGRPPYPTRVRCGIPIGATGRAERGAVVSVCALGDSVAVLWGTPVA
jgi:hypothetical protein